MTMNPFFAGASAPQRTGLNPQAVATVKGMLQNLKSVQNPDAVISRLAGSNPLLGNVMRMLNGRNPQQVFYAECQRMGIDPNEIINLLK